MRNLFKILTICLCLVILVVFPTVKISAEESFTTDKIITELNDVMSKAGDVEEVKPNKLESKTKNNNYVDLDWFNLIELGDDVLVWDRYSTLQGIRYYDYDDINYEEAVIRFLYASTEQYLKSDYIFLEEFREEDGVAVYQQGWYWDLAGVKGDILGHYFNKDYYNQEYLYFLLGVSDSLYVSEYDDYSYFKIKNPFYNPTPEFGWHNNDGIWYYYQNGEPIKGQWFAEAGNWYYFNSVGEMQTGFQSLGGVWYYFDDLGVMQTGWEKVDGIYYYFNSSGVMQRGWLKDGGVWYYLNTSGEMQTGWEKVDGTYYYFNLAGEMQKGWLKDGGVWYYLNTSGEMQIGWEIIGNTYYYFNTSGEMQTGWLWENGVWYYLNESGSMHIGWKLINNTWYYFYSSGAMATSTTIDGYQLNEHGHIIN